MEDAVAPKHHNAKGLMELKQSEEQNFQVLAHVWLNQDENEEQMDVGSK